MQKKDVEFDNKGIEPVKVPGFGLPVDCELDQWSKCFRHGANDFRANRLTVREVAMMRFMDSITDKPDWNRKVFDDTIVAKWRDEATSKPDLLISGATFDWCLRELQHNARLFEKDGFVKTLESNAPCAKSDTLIDQATQAELQSGVQPLLDSKVKDWHPGSNDQVLNLVHPSLYPLVYGRTRALRTGQVETKACFNSFGRGEVVIGNTDIPERARGNGFQMWIDNKSLWSLRFQWLPCEVAFQGDEGTQVKIVSYINNLHPLEHEALYPVIEKVISASIPLWNEVLIKSHWGRTPLRIEITSVDCEPPEPEWASDIEMEDDEVPQEILDYLALPDRPGFEQHTWNDEDPEDLLEDGDVRGAVHCKWQRIRVPQHPEPDVEAAFTPWVSPSDEALEKRSPKVKLEEQFRKEGLQVITKLSSIELMPEKPKYPGGSWHLEGMRNEHIVATAIYYYDVENVTPARIAFRQEASIDPDKLQYEQSDHAPLEEIFDVVDFSSGQAVQEIGSIATPEGRLLVFPNTLQHRVESFELRDPSKPGHRRFLVLWLVDPHYRVLSTANVPPQQFEWWQDAILEADLLKLPAELSAMITDISKDQDWLMDMAKAKELRLELMAERTSFGDAVESNMDTYNLCEH